MMVGARDFTAGGAASSADTRWSQAQGGTSLPFLSEILTVQIGPSTPDFTEEGSTSEEAVGGEPGVDEELSTIGNDIKENSSISKVTRSQDTSMDSVESVTGNASNTSAVIINNNSSSPATKPICGRLTTCDEIIDNNDSNNRQCIGSFSPPLYTDALSKSDQSLSRSG